jgi:hypothetical protein
MASENLIRDEDVLTLVLRENDYLHLVELLDVARESLPSSTDSIRSQATLRAALEFLRENESSCAAEAHTEAAPRSGTMGDAQHPGALARRVDALQATKRAKIALSATEQAVPCLQEALRILAGDDCSSIVPETQALLLAVLMRATQLADVAFDALNVDSVDADDVDVEQLQGIVSGVDA